MKNNPDVKYGTGYTDLLIFKIKLNFTIPACRDSNAGRLADLLNSIPNLLREINLYSEIGKLFFTDPKLEIYRK